MSIPSSTRFILRQLKSRSNTTFGFSSWKDARIHEALTTNETPNGTDELFAWLHVGIGTAILLAVVARLYLRFKHGAPGPAPGTTAQQAKMADILHWLLYALLLAMVFTGMIT